MNNIDKLGLAVTFLGVASLSFQTCSNFRLLQESFACHGTNHTRVVTCIKYTKIRRFVALSPQRSVLWQICSLVSPLGICVNYSWGFEHWLSLLQETSRRLPP